MNRYERSVVVDYFDAVKDGNYDPPSMDVQRCLAKKLDEVTKTVIDRLSSTLSGSPEHRQRIEEIEDQPRLAGKSCQEKAILEQATPFEQYFALQAWQQKKQIRKTHTFIFSTKGGEDYIPVSVKASSAMQVVLGATKGEKKAPKYAEWEIDDPRDSSQQENFIAPLEALEIVRQPQFSAATLIKGSAFMNDCIDNTWRYGEGHACVESKGQSKLTKKKEASAGLNMTELFAKFSDRDDNANMVAQVKYEDYVEDGYDDDTEVSVTPYKLYRATKKSILLQDDEGLKELIYKLFAAQIGPPETPALRRAVARKLF